MLTLDLDVLERLETDLLTDTSLAPPEAPNRTPSNQTLSNQELHRMFNHKLTCDYYTGKCVAPAKWFWDNKCCGHSGLLCDRHKIIAEATCACNKDYVIEECLPPSKCGYCGAIWPEHTIRPI